MYNDEIMWISFRPSINSLIITILGQRPGLKYWYDKEWLTRGHMHGLAFLEDNYSHQNAKKIVATHQLLGDVQRVIEVLHGLQLKMSILQ